MFCQKCRAPLQLHASLEDQLSPAAFDLLVGQCWKLSLENICLLTSALIPIGSTTLPPKLKQSSSFSKPPYPLERRGTYDKANQNTSSAIFKRVVPTARFPSTNGLHESHSSMGMLNGTEGPYLHTPARSIYQNPTESFVYLTESQVAVPPAPIYNGGYGQENGMSADFDNGDDRNTMSHKMNVAAKMFGIMSAKSDIDHPVCMECTEILVEGLTKRLANVTRERDAYVEYLKKVNADLPTQEEKLLAEKEYQAIKAEEALAIQSLKDMERQKSEVLEELRQLEEEATQLTLEEESFWRDRNAFAQQLEEFQNERDGVNLQYDHDSRQLERLQRTNVYNDTFCIGHDGYFGTINGLRLGRLPHQPVCASFPLDS